MVTVDPEGRPVLWLGLSEENRLRLPMEPILVDLPDHGLELKGGRLVVLAGRDEETIAAHLKTLGFPVPDDPLPSPSGPQQSRPLGPEGAKL